MNKVICDICGTSYPSTAKKCPICGSSREYALENGEDTTAEFDFLTVEEEPAPAPVPRKKNKEIFDFDEANQPRPASRRYEEEVFDDEEEYEEESRSNVGLVIVLVILIVLLLLTAGFFFVKYLLPGMMPEETQPVVTTEAVQTEPVVTTDPGKPCTNLMMDGGKMELAKDGKKLLNVRVYPEDTTDVLTFVSGNEAIATVSEDGTVTAVGEGETVITVTCGMQQILCNVTVDYSIGEETVPTEEIPPMEVEDTIPAETVDATEATESAEATTETTEADPVLKLKTSDITIGYRGASVPIELEGELDPKQVTWTSRDGSIAFVNGDACIIAVGSGLTRIVGEYGGESVEIIVRCVF